MAKQRLFPEPEDKRNPQKRFNEAASKIFSTPKATIDEREKQWRKKRTKA